MTASPKNNGAVLRGSPFLYALLLLGGLLLGVGLFAAPERTWSNVLVATFFLLTLGLGGAVFLALAEVCGAGWHVAFRRVPETLARLILPVGVVMLIVLAARARAYGWQSGGGEPGTFWFKEWWLTPRFWMVRSIAYVGVWAWFCRSLVARGPRPRVRRSALFLAVFAVSFSLASIDWLMALEPMWFSTMWGVYHFAGMMQASLAAVILLAVGLSRPGAPLAGVVRTEHLHDLGKLLLGFSCFWMYIWFSQYMLIWYANLPEETSYFIARAQGRWSPVVGLLIALNWVIPFFALLPRPSKRSATILSRIAVVVLAGRWVDLYLIVFPDTAAGSRGPVFGVWEAAALAVLVASGILLARSRFPDGDPVPTGDPWYEESRQYHAG